MPYPYTINNGCGEELTFVGRTIRDGIEYLQVKNCIGPGSGPPMHLHFHQDESLTVVEGIMGVQQLGEKPRLLHAGESVSFSRGVMHRFWNAGEIPLRCVGEITPPHNIEYFLAEIYRSVRENRGKPGLFDSAFLLTHFSPEFEMNDIPKFVKKVIFPIILVAGRLKGLHKKYSNAPAPVKK